MSRVPWLVVLAGAGLALLLLSGRGGAPAHAGDRPVSYGSASGDIGDAADVLPAAFVQQQPARPPADDPAAPLEGSPTPAKLSEDLTEDDFPSVAVDADGAAWAVWQAYAGSRDEIRLRRKDEAGWHTYTRLPGISGDVWRPQVLIDGSRLLWVVWAQQAEGNWDLYARPFDGRQWLPEQRLTSDPLPDINHQAVRAPNGDLVVVWQGFRPGARTHSDIFLKRYDHTARRWSGAVRVSSDPANDWDPSVAVDGSGAAWVSWDTYQTGSYDVVLQRVALSPAPKVDGAPVAVANSPGAEMRSSVACDPTGRVWVAYEAAGVNWGKDQGYTVRRNPVGIPLGGPREVRIRVLENAQLREPAAFSAAFPENERSFFYTPHLLADSRGRMWLEVRHRSGRPNPNAPPARPRRQKTFWREWVTRCDGDHWSPAVLMPQSLGRQSAPGSIASGPDGSVWLAWSTDNRKGSDYHRPVKTEVLAARLEDAAPSAEPVLRDLAPETQPEPDAGKLGYHPHEAADLAAIRAYRAKADGAPMQIVRGDLHRHSELSWDSGGAGDGSILDFYRYMMDAAGMDYGAITDHNAGGDYQYWWWYGEKLADMYHAPGGYVPLFAYERSAVFPNGHRNVVHAYRGVPVVSFFTRPDLSGPRPGIGTGALLDNDTKLLYAELQKSNGICIPHTSATRMGTDWRDNGGDLEPVVELFQGARTSSEYAGAPKSADPQKDAQHIRQAGYQPEGFVWNAWKKGYRLGVITSSDHGSTHMSYALVYTSDPSRRGIVDAIRKRHTYGATDNIILEFRMGSAFMGDQVRLAKIPPATIRIRGTGELSRVDLIRNDQFLYNTDPKGSRAELQFQDAGASPGGNYYYVRVQQEDGQIAWSSPIWIDLRP